MLTQRAGLHHASDVGRTILHPAANTCITHQTLAGQVVQAGEGMTRTRLGAVRRWILREVACHPVQISKGAPTRSAQELRRRAAKALAALGLIEVYKTHGYNSWGSRCPGILHCRITDRGRAVIYTYRREIETGRPIRWARFEAHAAA